MNKSVLVHSSGNYTIPVPLSDNLQSNLTLFNFNRPEVTVFGNFASWLRTNALEPDRVKIVGAVWSPPHWMKGPTGFLQCHVSNPSVTNPTPWLSLGTSGDSIGGRLLQDTTNLTQFARYLAAWVKGFEQRFGIPLYAISLQNELSFENPFDSCTYERGAGTTNTPGPGSQWWQYASALKAVKDTFATFGLNVKIKGPHCAGVKSTPANPWELNQQMKFIEAVKLHSDTGLIDRLDIYCSNGYVDAGSNAVKNLAAYWRGKHHVPANWAWWLYAPGVMNDGKITWFSEVSGEASYWLTNGTPGDGALVLAQKIHNALVYANVSTYLYWQTSDDKLTENNETLLGKSKITNPHSSKKYCAYKHFARYIRPGAQRVRATFENGLASLGGANEYDTYNSLNATAFVHDADESTTIVFVNMRPAAYDVTIVLTAAPPAATYQVYRTSLTEGFARQPDLVPLNNQLSITLPGYSVVTLYGQVPEPLLPSALVLLLSLRHKRV